MIFNIPVNYPITQSNNLNSNNLNNNLNNSNINNFNNNDNYSNGKPPPRNPPVSSEVLNRIPATNPEKDLENSFTLDNVDLSNLTEDQRQKVIEMLKPYEKMWSGHLGTVKTAEHRIDLLPDSKPFRSQPYRAGPLEREMQHAEVQRQLAKGVIEPSKSQWASPVLLVPKPDGTKRFCVDYRKLNEKSIKDSYPLPRMDDCIDSLGDAKFFTTLDANSGYWQIFVREQDRHKTAFVCYDGCYQYIRMPFGLCNAPPTFQRTMDITLSNFRWKTCLVYLDDVIVFSESFEEHLRHVSEILSCLSDAGFSLKLAKCEFFKKTN